MRLPREGGVTDDVDCVCALWLLVLSTYRQSCLLAERHEACFVLPVPRVVLGNRGENDTTTLTSMEAEVTYETCMQRCATQSKSHWIY